MSKHFTSVLQLVPEEKRTAINETGLASLEQGGLTVNHTNGSRTVSLPQQPRPLSSPSSGSQVSFTFDKVFDEHQSLSANYRQSVKEVVENVLLGYHGTVVSFGTQQAQDMKGITLRDPIQGAIRKATEQIFRCLKKSRRSRVHSQACSNLVVYCSFVIVINENVHDLLYEYSPDGGSTVNPEGFGLKAGSMGSIDDLDLDTKVHVIPPKLSVVNGSVSRASQQEVKSAANVASLLSYSEEMEQKVLDAYHTETNKTGGIASSPNHIAMVTNSLHTHHLVCTITVEYAQFGTMNAPVSGNLSFIEVASADPLSSRQKHTKGDHISKEMESLFNFADIVNSLTSNAASLESMSSTGSAFDLDSENTVSPFVPSVKTANLYSQSTLMQILKEAFGGNCKTLLISLIPKHISPGRYVETLETLKLASRARVIQNNPNKKDLAEKALMSAYMRGLHDMYGRGVSAKDEALKPQKKRIVLTPATSPIATSPPPSFGPGMGKGGNVMAGSKDSILSDDIDTAYNEMIGMTQGEERQRNMEMAATALVAAALAEGDRGGDEEGGEGTEGSGSDSSSTDEEENEDIESSTHLQVTSNSPNKMEDRLKPDKRSDTLVTNKNTRPLSTKVRLKRKSQTQAVLESLAADADDATDIDVSVDALITILQDPDKGVPRPSVSDLANVRLRNDVGAIFSGASIVAWMIANVDGVKNEKEAISLGEVLLNKGALVHSEGSMVFANAETLFYYARQGRPSRRTLSHLEIQSLLAQTKLASSMTIVSPSENSDSLVPGMAESIQDSASKEKQVSSEYSSRDGHEGGVSATEHELTDHPKPPSSCGQADDTSVQSFDETDFGTPMQPSTTDQNQPSNSSSAEVSKSPVHPFAQSGSLPCSPDDEDSPSTFTETPYHLSHPEDTSYQEGKGPSKASAGVWEVRDMDVVASPMLGWRQETGQTINGEEEAIETTLSSTGEILGHTHEEGDGCVACLQEKDRISREEAELLKVQEEDTSEPNTAPVEHIPTVQTLESTENYPHPLHMAVAIGKSPGVVRELVMMFGVNKLDDFKRTPLMFAALGNNKRSSCSTLIECGADVNRQDISGLTALHVACYHGNKAATNVLLNKGAIINIIDATGHCALHWSTVPESHGCLQLLMKHAWPELVDHTDRSHLTALHWAIHFNRPKHLALLLKKCSDPEKLDSEGRTLVSYALEKGAFPCVKVLITAHPSLLSYPDANQSCPLHHASAQTSPDSLLLLLTHKLRKKDASFAPAINCTNSYQRTPLHCAVAYNSIQNVFLLVSRGADTQLCDNEGKTPLDYARELEDGGEEILAILEGRATVELPSIDTSREGSRAESSKFTESRPVSTSSSTSPSKICGIL